MKPRLKASPTLHLQGPEGLKGGTLHLKVLKVLKVKPRLKPSATPHLQDPEELGGCTLLLKVLKGPKLNFKL